MKVILGIILGTVMMLILLALLAISFFKREQ